MTPRERGQHLRRAVNESIACGKVWYEKLDEERYVACVSYIDRVERIDNPMEAGQTTYIVGFDVDFVPDQIDYNGVHVHNLDQPVRVDWKSYCWTVRALSEHMVLEKLRTGEEPDDF